MSTRYVRLAICLVAAVTTACGASAGTAPVTSSANAGASDASPGGVRTVSMSRLTDGEPTERPDATILIGFDAATAASMVRPAPAIDFATQALLCLYIGERSTGGWSVTIQSISIDGTELEILAREVEPRPGVAVTQAFTYPADCAVIERAALPIGELAVRADDSTSEEFIVDAVVQVPGP